MLQKIKLKRFQPQPLFSVQLFILGAHTHPAWEGNLAFLICLEVFFGDDKSKEAGKGMVPAVGELGSTGMDWRGAAAGAESSHHAPATKIRFGSAAAQLCTASEQTARNEEL